MSREHSIDGGATIDASATPAESQLKSLNLDFLRLLVLELEYPATAHLQLAGLSPELTSELGASTDTKLAELAECPFSLFTLGLQNADLWQRIALIGAHENLARRYAVQDAGRDDAEMLKLRRSGFMECALFYAWHLAQCDRAAARVRLGVRDDTAETLRSLKLWQLHCVAYKYPQMLAPRWPGNSCFWPDLIRYLHSGDRRHFDYACLLGSQLLAQDLEPSAIERLTNIRQNLFRSRAR